jgi:DNA repair exonuclease SbcCD nuclease subunit
MPIKILATGDLHIGLSVSGLPLNAGVFSARSNWERIVDWAIDNEVNIVALTGDIVEKDNCFFEAVGVLQQGFKKLGENNVEVYAVAGNHDYEVLPQIIKSGNLSNVHLLGAGGKWELAQFAKGKEKIQFAGWSFTRQYIKEDPLRLYSLPDIDPDIPSIGLLHGDAYASVSNYAPINVAKLKTVRLDAWILGHIHKPEVLNEADPFICYPGSPLALSAKETGVHSLLLFTVSNNKVKKPENVLFSPVRYEDIEVDITGSGNEEELRLIIIGGIMEKASSMDQESPDTVSLVCNVTCTGTHRDTGLIESWSRGLTEGFSSATPNNTRVFVREVNISIEPEITNIRDLAGQKTPAGLLAQIIISIEDGNENEHLRQLYNRWKESYRQINHSETFIHLDKGRELTEMTEVTAKTYILKESKRLLGELLKQKSE